MAAAVAAASTPVEAGSSLGKAGTTAETAVVKKRLEEPFQAAEGTERTGSEEGADSRRRRPSSGSVRDSAARHRRHPGERSHNLRSGGLVALAVGFAIAVSALHRVVWCLQGALRQKKIGGVPAGVLSRRLGPGEEVGSDSPHLPSYEEALDTATHEPWGAPPPYSEDGLEAPPPVYEDVCRTNVWTVSQPVSSTEFTTSVLPRSALSSHGLEVTLVTLWVFAVIGGILLNHLTSFSGLESAGIAFAAAIALTVAVLAAGRKIRQFRELRERNQPGPVEI